MSRQITFQDSQCFSTVQLGREFNYFLEIDVREFVRGVLFYTTMLALQIALVREEDHKLEMDLITSFF